MTFNLNSNLSVAKKLPVKITTGEITDTGNRKSMALNQQECYGALKAARKHFSFVSNQRILNKSMSENRISICVIGGNKTEMKRLSGIIDACEFSTVYFHVKSKENLLEQVALGQCHIVVGNSCKKGFNIFAAADIINQINTHVPVIGVYDETEFSIVEVMEKGLSDFVDLNNHQHLHLVLKRELLHVELVDPETHISGKDFTGLYSRLQFIEYLEKQISGYIDAEDYQAILYLQLDNFSWINETNGILSGDIFLKNTARIIANLIQEHDVAARYQGGSFIILVQSDSIKKIIAKADMFREAIAEAISEIDDTSNSSTCSVGIRLINDASQTISDIITDAFKASEKAKFNGGDSVHLFKKQVDESEANQEKHAWNNRIKDAFDNDLFLLFYQPIISLQDDVKPRYEVFLRMIDRDNNIISPGTFLPHAERAGLMADIDRRVILHSLEKGTQEAKKDKNVEIFMKLSGRSLDDKKMHSWIGNTLKDFDFPNENIIFEITESLAHNHLAQARHMVRSLKLLGCKIALDHFGTKLKSFKLLQQLDVDYLKVDGSLVQNLAYNRGHQAIVKKIVKIARKKRIKLIAESVQEASYLPVIWQYDFNFVQGYFLQVPDEEMTYDFSNSLM
ncbi:MAG: bifunctional diguanylate cyclase/phosphodiesterase [Gammaproteobacteria bacterium]|nr:bifunctional diguanylate cyclase/phosphodiesterase [Gammaproteobacteria bacterium]